MSLGSRRFHCRSSLFRAKNFLDQRLKARLVAHTIVNRVNLQIPTGALLVLVRFFQPIQSFLLFAKSQVDVSERCRTDVLPFCHLFEFAQDLLGLGEKRSEEHTSEL